MKDSPAPPPAPASAPAPADDADDSCDGNDDNVSPLKVTGDESVLVCSLSGLSIPQEPHYSHYYYHTSSMSSTSSPVRHLNVGCMGDISTAVALATKGQNTDEAPQRPRLPAAQPAEAEWKRIGMMAEAVATIARGGIVICQETRKIPAADAAATPPITEIADVPPSKRRLSRFGRLCRDCLVCVSCGPTPVLSEADVREEEELRDLLGGGDDGAASSSGMDLNKDNYEGFVENSYGVIRRRQTAALSRQVTTMRSIEDLLNEYAYECSRYYVRPNPGIMTALRHRLPTIRPDGSFHDADMLALCEVLLRRCNDTEDGGLGHVVRLDFGLASKFGTNPRIGEKRGHRGFRSHGALTLSKVLLISKYIRELYLQRHRIGPYGGTALAIACSKNKSLRVLSLRRCILGERGARAFVDYIVLSPNTGLREVDVSANRIGFAGIRCLELSMESRRRRGLHRIKFDLEGNLVFQEVMNSVTHGLGILLIIVGTIMLSARAAERSRRHVVSCAVYSASLLVLYTSSTLFHSFFTMRLTKEIFNVMVRVDHIVVNFRQKYSKFQECFHIYHILALFLYISYSLRITVPYIFSLLDPTLPISPSFSPTNRYGEFTYSPLFGYAASWVYSWSHLAQSGNIKVASVYPCTSGWDGRHLHVFQI